MAQCSSQQLRKYVPFRESARCLLVGPSSSGKTEFLIKVIRERERFFEVVPKHILFCSHSNSSNSIVERLKSEVVQSGDSKLPLVHFLDSVPPDNYHIEPYTAVIFDDFLSGSDSDKYTAEIVSFFTRRSHHERLYTFLVTQSLFSPNRHFRLLAQNINYIVLFRSPRSLQQIRYMTNQLLGDISAKDLVNLYKTVVSKKPYGYLFFDLHPQSEEIYRYQTNLFQEDNQPLTLYVSKELIL